MTKATTTQLYLTSSTHEAHNHEGRSITVNLGEVKSDWGKSNYVVRSSAMGDQYVEACMAVTEVSGSVEWNAQSRLTVTFQLSVTMHFNTRHTPYDSHDRKRFSLGPQSEIISKLRTGPLITSTFTLPKDKDWYDVKIAINQLGVTVTAAPNDAPTSPPFPRPADLFSTINAPHLCDCTLALADGSHLHVSKAILAHASPAFFGTLFKRPGWTSSPGVVDAPHSVNPVKFDSWSIKAVLPCLAHMYTGWLPTADPGSVLQVPCSTQVATYSEEEHEASAQAPVNADTSMYSLMDWNEVLELAQMLELPELAVGVKKAMIQVLKK